MHSSSKVWVCMACGKHSEDRYGRVNTSHGWDVSCFVNSILCYTDKLEGYPGMVTKVLEGGVVEQD